MVAQLLAGMFLGSIIASLVWGCILKSVKNRADDSRREREEVMRSLGELWVEIDSLFSSHRSRVREDKGFRQTFSSKIEAVNKLLKPNLHMLDIYYVKYIENLIAGYSRIAFKGGEPVEHIVGASSEIERETSFSVVEQSEPSAPSGLSRATEGEASAPTEVFESFIDQPVAETAVTFEQKKTTTAPETEAMVSSDDKTEATAAASLPIPDELAELEVVIPPEKETSPVEGEAALPQKTVATPKEEPASFAVEEHFELKPAEEPDKKTVPEETFEKAASTVQREPAAGEEEITFEKSSEATRETIYGVEEPVFESGESDRKAVAETATGPEKKPPADFFEAEDFSMETLMDVDVSTVSPFMKDDSVSKADAPTDVPEQTAVFEVSADAGDTKTQPAEESLEVVIASNVSHTETPTQAEPESPSVKADRKAEKTVSIDEDAISEETTITRADDLANKVRGKKAAAEFSPDEDFEAIFEQEPAARTPDETTGVSEETVLGGVTQDDIDAFDKEEEIITGDDVVEKIASWESRKPVAPTKPAAKKEKKREKAASVKSGAAKTHSTAGTKSHASSGKKSSPHPASKRKAGDDTITGDDVADKIDSFFGLFKKK
ncbi:MAG: hypothetical protein JXA18_11725 [Chitinispirillaceae bacterium]|nr:hypothetical protein [Chitinispirillaceae bacterium]